MYESTPPKANFSELYASISEGFNFGFPCLVLRFYGSNLPDRNDKRVYAFQENVVDYKGLKQVLSVDEVLEKIAKFDAKVIFNWYICGGEPLLQQEFIKALFDKFTENYGQSPVVDIETNGLVEVKKELEVTDANYIIKVRLANSTSDNNSKNTFGSRVNPEILKSFYYPDRKIRFVFSVKGIGDISEIQEIQKMANISTHHIYLSPLFTDFVSYRMAYSVILNACLGSGYNLSPEINGLVFGFKPGL